MIDLHFRSTPSSLDYHNRCQLLSDLLKWLRTHSNYHLFLLTYILTISELSNIKEIRENCEDFLLKSEPKEVLT